MTIWRMRIACWLPKAINTHTHTHITCNIHCFSTATVAARTHLNFTFYVHCLCCYKGNLCVEQVNPLNAELNPICYLLALLGAHHFLHVSRIRVKSLTLRLQMSYIYMEHPFLMFLDHTQRRSTVGRTHLDE